VGHWAGGTPVGAGHQLRATGEPGPADRTVHEPLRAVRPAGPRALHRLAVGSRRRPPGLPLPPVLPAGRAGRLLDRPRAWPPGRAERLGRRAVLSGQADRRAAGPAGPSRAGDAAVLDVREAGQGLAARPARRVLPDRRGRPAEQHVQSPVLATPASDGPGRAPTPGHRPGRPSASSVVLARRAARPSAVASRSSAPVPAHPRVPALIALARAKGVRLTAFALSATALTDGRIISPSKHPPSSSSRLVRLAA
jgi:hypothetical protein